MRNEVMMDQLILFLKPNKLIRNHLIPETKQVASVSWYTSMASLLTKCV
uniref:Uncharacterized protein n=1 Tax=Arundo donax TaxID=35708 RepID=A0A0A9F5G2_ARUDO